MTANLTGILVPELELQPCKSSQLPSPQCTAARHGNRPAYLDGCRCDTARHAYVRYQKQWNYDRSHGRPRRVPAIGAQRRVQALACMGWSTGDIGQQLGRRGRLNLNRCDLVSVDLHLRIAALFDKLGAKRGPSPATAKLAVARGWLPPLAWDDDTIDDPTFTPTRQVAQQPGIDPVAVHRRAIDRDLTITLNPAEKAAALTLLISKGHTPSAAATQLGINATYARRYLATAGIPDHLEETG